MTVVERFEVVMLLDKLYELDSGTGGLVEIFAAVRNLCKIPKSIYFTPFFEIASSDLYLKPPTTNADL
jgi:hypothetical protein